MNVALMLIMSTILLLFVLIVLLLVWAFKPVRSSLEVEPIHDINLIKSQIEDSDELEDEIVKEDMEDRKKRKIRKLRQEGQ